MAEQSKAERLQAIADEIARGAGVAYVEYHRRGLRGDYKNHRSEIVCPKPTSERAMFVLAKQCGHMALMHRKNLLDHWYEYEAAEYARRVMERHGLTVPEASIKEARVAVSGAIERWVKQRLRSRYEDPNRSDWRLAVDRDALAFCDGSCGAMTRGAIEDGELIAEDCGCEARITRALQGAS